MSVQRGLLESLRERPSLWDIQLKSPGGGTKGPLFKWADMMVGAQIYSCHLTENSLPNVAYLYYPHDNRVSDTGSCSERNFVGEQKETA